MEIIKQNKNEMNNWTSRKPHYFRLYQRNFETKYGE